MAFMARGTKTTEFLKECMSDALIKLMSEKSIDKITITDITDLADVGRSTWFRNFSTKSEALSFKLVKLWERYVSEYQDFHISNAKVFFEFNYSIQNVLKTIYNAEMQHSIYDACCIVLLPQNDVTALDCYKCRFYAYGIYGLLDEWIKRDFKETPDEMAELFSEIINDQKGL